MKISQDVLVAIDGAVLAGPTLTLQGQLDRTLYQRVAKVIEMAGGKWNRREKCHTFPHDAADTIDQLLLTGEISDTKRDLGQFFTPMPLAHDLVALAGVRPEHLVLEPSVGSGNLVAAIVMAQGGGANVFGYELDPRLHRECRERRYRAFGAGGLMLGDFLAAQPVRKFDRVVMNPPFARRADIDHVTHAFRFLRPGGRLAAIMSNGVTFRRDRKTLAFRELLERHHGEVAALPNDAFLASGTNVRAVMIRMDAD